MQSNKYKLDFKINKISIFLVILSILLLLYIFFKSVIILEFNNFDLYYIYYGTAIGFLLISFFSFFLSSKIRENIILILISSMITFYSIEIFLELNFKYSFIKFKKDILVSDNFSKLEEMREKNPKTVIPILPNKDVSKKFWPLSGIQNRNTVYCNESGYWSTYHSDRYGFNNPDYIWDNEKFDYMLVGDSFTHGACVNRPDDIASVLRLLSNKSVLNLGYAAKGPLSEYATLREYIRPNIKKIVWFYF